MKDLDVIDGETYVIDTNITGEMVTQVFNNKEDKEFPFKISAADFKIQGKNIKFKYQEGMGYYPKKVKK